MKKKLCLFLVLSMLLGLLTACGSTSETTTEEETTTTVSASEEVETTAAEESAGDEEPVEAETEQETEVVEEAEEMEAEPEQTASTISYPLGDKSETITLWTTIPGNQTDIMPNGYNDHFLMSYVEDALGVDIDITSVAQIGMGDNTAFNLMIAAGDWPDLLSVDSSYNGGLAQAFSDEVIIELTEEMLSTYAPDYYNVLMSQSEETIRATQTNGTWCAVYSITVDAADTSTRGMVIRTDWLDELGMEMPSTIDELTDILKAFKTEYDPTYTYFIEADADLVYMCAAFNTSTVGYYNDGALPVYRQGDEITMSWVTDEYREFIEWFRECYEYGVFEPSFYVTASDESSNRYTYLLNGEIGVYEDSPTSIADWRQYADEGQSVEVSFFPNLVDDEGNNTWGDEVSVLGTDMSITADCENPELALQVLNYFFTDEGAILANYGVEDYTFVYDSDGEVEYTELVTESEYQLSMRALHGLYSWGLTPAKAYSDALYPLYSDEVVEALEIMSGEGVTSEHYYPNGASLTTEESESIITKVTDIATYCQEQLLKYMTCADDLTDESWDAYVEHIYSLGLQDCLDVYQNAYDEYVAGER